VQFLLDSTGKETRLVKHRVSLYPGFPDEVRRIVLTHSVSIEGEGECCAYTLERHYAEEVANREGVA